MLGICAVGLRLPLCASPAGVASSIAAWQWRDEGGTELYKGGEVGEARLAQRVRIDNLLSASLVRRPKRKAEATFASARQDGWGMGQQRER
eukprot:8030635-Pyramimonas_sp.AAC.1